VLEPLALPLDPLLKTADLVTLLPEKLPGAAIEYLNYNANFLNI